ncbi:phenylacetate--CoA ligase family protein [Thalassotalea fonticola]|uniref:Phenylacetate--CoA ligase family protein n=1 Tax=Thalassotalea fonticola TaxID=3065649 RepID=A0ABZ0GLS7_9GAMM|nr:phenylacetate--CoA ligase family protein [Colwelliaceae bacterium S1-1]
MNVYEKLFKSCLFPVYEKLHGRNTTTLLKAAQQRLNGDLQHLKFFQLAQLKKLLSFCQQQVPYYQKQWQQLGFNPQDVNSIDDLQQLPVLTKQLVSEHYDELIPSTKRETNIKKSTGGSTGRPFHFELDKYSDETRQAIMWRGYGWLQAGLGRKTWYLWGVELGKLNWLKRVKDWSYHRFHNRKIANSFLLNQHTFCDYIEEINAYQPQAIVSYVAPLYALAKFINSQKITVFPPQIILTGAEALLEYQRQEIELAFKCKVINTYGCREFMLIAAECAKQQGLHINIDQLVVETVDEQLQQIYDEPGDILITDLHNYGMPLIRYMNGDQACLSNRVCSCGNPLPIMENISGRKLDIIRNVEGGVLPGEFFPHLIKDFKGIERFQVKQKMLASIDLYYQVNKHFIGDELTQIEQQVKLLLSDSFKVNFHLVESIALSKSGKHRVTISELEQ